MPNVYETDPKIINDMEIGRIYAESNGHDKAILNAIMTMRTQVQLMLAQTRESNQQTTDAVADMVVAFNKRSANLIDTTEDVFVQVNSTNKAIDKHNTLVHDNSVQAAKHLLTIKGVAEGLRKSVTKTIPTMLVLGIVIGMVIAALVMS